MYPFSPGKTLPNMRLSKKQFLVSSSAVAVLLATLAGLENFTVNNFDGLHFNEESKLNYNNSSTNTTLPPFSIFPAHQNATGTTSFTAPCISCMVSSLINGSGMNTSTLFITPVSALEFMAKKKKKSKTMGERVDAAYSGCFDDKTHSDGEDEADEEEDESPTSSKSSDKKSDKKSSDEKDADSENDASECEEGDEDLYLPSKKKMKKATKHWILENPGWAAVIGVILLCILCRCAKSLCKRIKRCLVLLFPCCCKRKPAKKVVRRNTQHNIGPKLKSSKNEWGFDDEHAPLLPGGTPKSGGRKSFFGFLHPKVRAKQVLEQRKKEEKLAKLKRAKSLSKLSTGSSQNACKSSKSSDSRRSKSVSGRKSLSGRKSVTSSKISNNSNRYDRIVVSGKQTIASLDSNVVPGKKVSAPSVSIKKASTQEALKEYKERKAKKDKKLNRKRSASSSSSGSSSSDSEDDARKSSSKNSKLSTNFAQKSADISKNSFYKKRTTSAAIDGLSKLNLNSSEGTSMHSDQKVFLEDALNEDIVTPVHGRGMSSRVSKEKENTAVDSKISGHSRLSKESKVSNNFIREFDFTSAKDMNATKTSGSSDRRKSIVAEKKREKSLKKSSTRSNLKTKEEASSKTSSKTSSSSRRKSVKYESAKETNSSNSSGKNSEKSSNSSSRRKSVTPKKSSSGELRAKKRDQRR